MPGKVWIWRLALPAAVLLSPCSPARSLAESPAGQATTPAERKLERDRDGNPLPEGVIARLGTTRFRSQHRWPNFLLSPDGKTIALEDRFRVALLDAATGAVRHSLPDKASQAMPLCFSAEGRLFAMQSSDARCHRCIQMWSVTTGKLLWTAPQSESDYATALFAPDGKTFITLGVNDGVRIWEAATGKLLHRLPLAAAAKWSSIAASPNGNLLASLNSHTLQLQELPSGKVLRTLPRQEKLLDRLLFSADGRQLATMNEDRKVIHVWQMRTGKEVRIQAREELYPVPLQFSTDGRTLVTVSEASTTLYGWDTATGKKLWSLQSEDGIGAFALSPDSGSFAAQAGRTISLRELRTGQPIRLLSGRLAWLGDDPGKLLFSPDGKTLIARDQQALRTWTTATGKEVCLSLGQVGAEREPVTIAADGRRVAVTSWGLIHVWETGTGQLVQIFRGHEGGFIDRQSVALSADGRVAASVDALFGSKVRLWETDSGRERYHFKQPVIPFGKGDCGVALDLSSDGRRLAVATRMSSRVDLRDTVTGRLQASLTLPRETVDGLRFSPDGATLAAVWSVGKLPTIELWNVASTPMRGASLSPGRRPFFSEDGRLLAALDDKVVRIWELASGKVIHTFRGPTTIDTITFLPSGEILAAGIPYEEEYDADNTVGAWEVLNGRKLRPLRVPGNRFRLAAFVPGSMRLATAMDDTSVLIWDLAAFRPRKEECSAPLNASALERLWADLAGPDAERAYRAIRRLSAAPAAAVPFLCSQLRPALAGRLPRLIADLDADGYATREAAAKELAGAGPEAAVALRAALTRQPSLEAQRRIERVLAQLQGRPLPPELLRQVRAVQALEYAGTAAARRLLQALAGGWQDALLTREARASLQRLSQRSIPRP